MIRNLFIAAAIIVVGYATVNLMRDDTPTAARATAVNNPSPSSTPQTMRNGERDKTAPTANSGQPTENSKTTDTEAEKKEEQPQQRRGMFGGVLARQAATSVEVTWVEPSDQTAVIQLFGLIEAQQSVTVTATSVADVVAINAQEGDTVTAGSSLVSMVSASTSEMLQQRQASLRELDATIRNQQRKHQNDQAALEIEQELLRIAKNSVDRFSSLSNQQLTSSDSYEGALQRYQSQLLSVQNRQLAIAQHDDTMQQFEAQRAQLQSQLRQAQQLVDDLSVLAPFDGRLAKVSVRQGQKVSNGTELVDIYSADSLALTVRVPLRYRLDQLDLESLSAKDSLGNSWRAMAIRPINEAGAQRLTLVPINSTNIQTLPGTHVSLSLKYPVNNDFAVVVPTTAVYDQQRVYLFDRGVIKPISVEVLGRSESGYVVRSDTFVGRTPIITTRIKNPISGMAVSIVNASGRQTQTGGAGS